MAKEAVTLELGKLLIAGGSKTVEVFDHATSGFSVASGEVQRSRHFMTETRLGHGRVLLAGGYVNNDRATAQTWLYKPE